MGSREHLSLVLVLMEPGSVLHARLRKIQKGREDLEVEEMVTGVSYGGKCITYMADGNVNFFTLMANYSDLIILNTPTC